MFHESFYVAGEREALLGTEVMYRKLTPDNVKAMTPEDYHYRTVEAQFYKRMLHDPENKSVDASVKFEARMIYHCLLYPNSYMLYRYTRCVIIGTNLWMNDSVYEHTF